MTMTDITQTGLGIREIIGDKRDTVLQLAAQHRATNVRVFGSVARGEATPESDVDVLVDFQSGYTLWDTIGLAQDLTILLGRKVDVANAARLRSEFRVGILRDAVSL
jgi:hypothetical protein